MSIAIKPVGVKPYNSLSKNDSFKAKQNPNVSFGMSFSTTDSALAGLGVLGTAIAIPGGLNYLGFLETQVPVVITMLGLSLPFISALGIFGSRSTHS